MFNKTLETELGSGLPESLGFNKARTSAPGFRYKEAEEVYWMDQVWGSVTWCKPLSPAFVRAILLRYRSPSRGTNEAVKEQRARRKQCTNRDEIVAVAGGYQTKNRTKNMTKIDTAFGSTIGKGLSFLGRS